jgi:hypothetical protein
VDYFSFEDVMKELELGEEELKRMVSEGELRAFWPMRPPRRRSRPKPSKRSRLLPRLPASARA